MPLLENLMEILNLILSITTGSTELNTCTI
ncbi:hypothetical protein MTLP_07330 [Candidatus Methanoliparum sp. LAM-1]|nr:hypothetical protein MTLP_07330 [Candidatus Methanoliparum sp. LAM-1]